MELAEEFSRRFPDYTIVVRPHPAERINPWHAKAATLPNVRVVREGNVAEWLLACEVCVHTNCTTGIEAYLLDRKSISYRPVRDSRFDLFLPNFLSAEAFELQEVVDLVAGALRGEALALPRDPRRTEVARHFIENMNGKHACAKIMDILESADVREEPLSIRVKPLMGLRSAVGRTLSRRDNAAEINDEIDTYQLLQLLDAARKISGRFHNLQAAEIDQTLHCIYRQ
jgi:hypothetical protein